MEINRNDEILIKHISPNEIKITAPLISIDELRIFDNNIHSIVEEYSKMQLSKKDEILTQRIIIKQEEEIKKLQELITELNGKIMLKDRQIKEALRIIDEKRGEYDIPEELEEILKDDE